MEDDRPRLLIFEGHTTRQHPIADALGQVFQVDVFNRMKDALCALRDQTYAAVFADVGDFLPLERALAGQQAALVLDTIGEGVCVIDADGACRWSNSRMRCFTPETFEKVKTICCQARSILASHLGMGSGRHAPRSKKFSFQSDNNRYFELIVSPVQDTGGDVRQVVAVVWEATSGRRLQQKIDTIDAAGRELARLDTDQIAQLSPDGRLRLLQDRIIRYSRDLLRFNHFAVRLLDKTTSKLEVVIAEGMPCEAVEIDLYGHPEGNGISGHVAATGRSYICHDTEKDPRYVLGIDHSKSSLTVPLWLHDNVIGVFNVESETVGFFNEDDRQFAEIFGRYMAMALNMLELLVVERFTTSGQMANSVVQEVAQPLNDIFTDVQTLMEQYIGDDSMQGQLGKIKACAESIRSAVREVAAGPKTILGSQHVEDSDAEPQFRDKRLLIADDELNIRETICRVLRKYGCVCTVCKDGFEAIRCIEQETFDLVLCDIKMPYRNGYEVFAAARRQRDDLPVILMTGFGYDPNHSIVRASGDGLAGVLFKPFKVEKLLDEIRQALRMTTADSPTPSDVRTMTES